MLSNNQSICILKKLLEIFVENNTQGLEYWAKAQILLIILEEETNRTMEKPTKPPKTATNKDNL